MSVFARNAIGFVLCILTLGLIFAVCYEGVRIGDERQEARAER